MFAYDVDEGNLPSGELLLLMLFFGRGIFKIRLPHVCCQLVRVCSRLFSFFVETLTKTNDGHSCTVVGCKFLTSPST